jgi:zinc protease
MINKYLGSLSAAKSSVPTAGRALESPPARTTVERSGAGPYADVAIILPGGEVPVALRDRLPLEILAAALEIRIFKRIREKEGASYAPSAGIATFGDSEAPGSRVRITVTFSCPPAIAEAMRQAAIEEIARLRQEGPSVEELNRAKGSAQGWSNAYRLAPVSWHDYLLMVGDRERYEFDPQYREHGIGLVGLEEVNSAARKYLNVEDAVQTIRLPAR